MKLSELLDITLLNTHLLNRVVSEMRHPEHKNLAIYNYTHVAQHDNVWDNVTELCRGLIVDTDTGEVLARPFRKFFNLNTGFRPETQEENLPVYRPRVLEKLDGSLGIFYTYAGMSYIATRGSFASDQAKWATEWYTDYKTEYFRSHVECHPGPSGHYQLTWPEGYTPLFEIIYKENRIVVSYEYEGLVLLGLVNIEDGTELPPEIVSEWGKRNGLRVAEEYVDFDLGKCKAFAAPNREGFVLQYWSSDTKTVLRLKIKTDDYVRLHKVITGLNPKGIWEHLSLGFDPQALWLPAATNQQFAEWCIGWINTFQRMYDKLESETKSSLGQVAISALQQINSSPAKLDERAARKVWALAIQQEPGNLQPALFACLSGGDWKKQLWKQLEPKIDGKEVYVRDADINNGL